MLRILAISLIVIIAGCNNQPEPPPNIPLPPDEITNVATHKNIKAIHKYNDRTEAIIIDKRGQLKYLVSRNPKIMVDATGEPWWEETEYKTYGYRWFIQSQRWYIGHSVHYEVVIHIPSFDSITHR